METPFVDLTRRIQSRDRPRHERRQHDRVDRRDLEPGPRLPEDLARLQALLRRDLRRALARYPRALVRARLRSPPRPREASGAAPLVTSPLRVRQLDERPL